MIVGALLELLTAGAHGAYLLDPGSALLAAAETDPPRALAVLLATSGWGIASGALACLLRGGGPMALWAAVALHALSIPLALFLAVLGFVPAATFGFFAVPAVALLMTSDGRAYLRRGPAR